MSVQVHLFDGTYELFRAWFGAPPGRAPDGREVGATRALLRSLWAFAREQRPTHVAVAFDHVIESFRNRLFAGYKTGEGLDPALTGQFELAERAAAALGFVVWPMVEFEADDALATAAHCLAADPAVGRVLLVSPDKDLAQCVVGDRVVCWDRLRDRVLDDGAVREKFGVPPALIADWLALVGDAADGIPGVPRWGEKSSAAVLAAEGGLDRIADDAAAWTARPRGADALAQQLREHRAEAALYRELATLRRDVPLPGVEGLREALAWGGPRLDALGPLCAELGAPELAERIEREAAPS